MIRQKLIHINKDFSNKEQILNYLIQEVENEGLIEDKDKYLSAVLKREAEISTALGYDLAIPHGKSETVKKPFIAFLRLNKSIEWDDGNQNDVKMIFLLGIPQGDSENIHLKMMATLCRKLMHDDFRETILSSSDQMEIFKLLTEIKI